MATDLSQGEAHGEVFGQVLKNISLLSPGYLQMHLPSNTSTWSAHKTMGHLLHEIRLWDEWKTGVGVVRDRVTAQWHSCDCLGLRNNSGGEWAVTHPNASWFCPRSAPSGTGGAAEVCLHSLEGHHKQNQSWEGQEQSSRNMGAAQVFFKREMRGWNETRWWRQGGDTKQVTPSKQALAKSGWTGGDQQTTLAKRDSEKSLHGLQVPYFWKERKKPGQQSWGWTIQKRMWGL